MAVVEAVAVDEAADTTHGPEGIGELRVRLRSRSYAEVKRRHNS